MSNNIAIVGLACEFPGAHSPDDLWETSIFQRRWFRNIPTTRLGSEYIDVLGEGLDTTCIRRAAVLEGYVFPHRKFNLGSTDLSVADFSHWLALDCAERAVADSGLGDALPRDSTRIIVGNSLTGESSRAELLRLRWPYVRKTLEESGCTGSEADWERREQCFKARLSRIDGRTLAGSLSNVIAGRIANHLDAHGGGYCVDAACASSLVAIAQACSQLVSREIDCCIVGGVDVSLDPLELVGFSVAGALARDEMTVFDRNRCGFLPGEGCGFAVLMRADHRAVEKCRVRALIRGWGISSDGRYDLTAPSVRGQRFALDRAYEMAGYPISSVPFFEAHGTGTQVGDQVELQTLSGLIGSTPPDRPAAVSSIKANIGHTKAAAGMAGLIKTVMALQTGVIPPTTGCNEPMDEVCSPRSFLRVPSDPEPWPDHAPRRGGVSGFGFGGANAHIALESADAAKPRRVTMPVRWQSVSQDCELFVFDGVDADDLRRRILRLREIASDLADAELGAAAKATLGTVKGRPWRAVIIARSPCDLCENLSQLIDALDSRTPLPTEGATHWGDAESRARIGFLFPGQGATANAASGRIWSRFAPLMGSAEVRAVTAQSLDSSASFQSALVATGIAGAQLLAAFGIEPSACVGHSLGEITALTVAGALSPSEAIPLSSHRGQLMDEHAAVGGMQVLMADENKTRQLINGHPVTIAAFNAAGQTVVSGSCEAIESVAREAKAARIPTVHLGRRFAFHSPLMQEAAVPFAAQLRKTRFGVASTAVYSTVTGGRLAPDTDLASHLASQITSPVRFLHAFEAARTEADCWIEVGVGNVLAGLVSPAVSVSMQAESTSLLPFLRALGIAFVKGAKVKLEHLYKDRRLPQFDLDWVPRFMTNPCERPLPPLDPSGFGSSANAALGRLRSASPIDERPTRKPVDTPLSALEAVRSAIRECKGDFPVESISDTATLGPDLSFDSLGVTNLALAVERLSGLRLDMGRVARDERITTMTVARYAELFSSHHGKPGRKITLSDQLVPWLRAFEIVWDEVELNALQPLSAAPLNWTVVSTNAFAKSYFPEMGNLERGLLIRCDAQITTPLLDQVLEALRTHLKSAPVVFLDSTAQLPGFAKAFALENPERTILFIHYPPGALPEFAKLCQELCGDSGFREVRYDAGGRRFLPRCSVIDSNPAAAIDLPLTQNDVVIVTGGAKGITAECMVALAARSRAKFALVGRSAAEYAGVTATCQKLTDLAISHSYWALDISGAESVDRLVAEVEERFGPVTALIHGAGVHTPCPVSDLTTSLVQEHCAAKVDGLRNLLAACQHRALKLLVAFGSIIARSGYRSAAAYALANDRLASMVAEYQCQHADVRCLMLDWSAWLETGMGVALDAIDPLKTAGVDPIRTDAGTTAFLEALSQPNLGPRPILSGRIPAFPTVSFRAPVPTFNVPGAHVVSATPGVEVVADIPISLATYPWLAGHAPDGRIVLPGVFALKLMAEVAAVALRSAPLSAQNIQWFRPIALRPSGLTLRVQAIRERDGTVSCRIAQKGELLSDSAAVAEFAVPSMHPDTSEPLPDPALTETEGRAVARDLYEHLLFHKNPFRIVAHYSLATARVAVFHLQPPNQVVDPVGIDVLLSDAFIHGIQLCVPEELLLPVRVESVRRYRSVRQTRMVVAKEVTASDGEFTYDLVALDKEGHVVEQWGGLLLRRYRALDSSRALHPVLRAISQERHTSRGRDSRLLQSGGAKRFYEYRHVVGFKETNVVGNVYFANHLEWQGRCREMFLREHAPDILAEIEAGRLVLATTSCSCRYEEEIRAFDEVSVRMNLDALGEDWASMRFEYWAERAGEGIRVAHGSQRVASRRRDPQGMTPVPLPTSLVIALAPFH